MDIEAYLIAGFYFNYLRGLELHYYLNDDLNIDIINVTIFY